MWDRFLRQAGREYSPGRRYVVLLPAAVVFLGVLPFVLLRAGQRVDGWLGWRTPLDPAVRVLGGLIGLGGWLLALWTIYVQFTEGRGTPLPVAATQELIVRPPYAYCRNPMALGTFLAYFGLGLAAGSPGAALLVVPGAAALLSCIKLVEEREMVARFGEPYLAYRSRVPFLILRLRGRG